jgi:hypothetical protein
MVSIRHYYVIYYYYFKDFALKTIWELDFDNILKSIISVHKSFVFQSVRRIGLCDLDDLGACGKQS